MGRPGDHSESDKAGCSFDDGASSGTLHHTKKDKVPLKLIVDHSQESCDFTHYMIMYLTMGIFNFYATLFGVGLAAWFSPWVYSMVKIPFTLIMGVIVASIFYPINLKNRPNWGLQFCEWMLRKQPAYFKLRMYCEDFDAVNTTAPAIFTLEPHDILPVSIFCFSSFLKYFPSHEMRGCTSSGIFAIPIMRHIFAWSGARSAHKSVIQNCLRNNISPALCPGGAMEVTFMTSRHDPHVCTLYLRPRWGVIKLAAEFGAPLVPAFTFNQRRTYSYYIPGNDFLHWLGRRIGFIPVFFLGCGNLPFNMPKSRPLNVVVGSPIPVPKMEAPFTEEKLKPYQDKFVAAYERIFEDNKEQFGMGHVKLQIL